MYKPIDLEQTTSIFFLQVRGRVNKVSWPTEGLVYFIKNPQFFFHYDLLEFWYYAMQNSRINGIYFCRFLLSSFPFTCCIFIFIQHSFHFICIQENEKNIDFKLQQYCTKKVGRWSLHLCLQIFLQMSRMSFKLI